MALDHWTLFHSWRKSQLFINYAYTYISLLWRHWLLRYRLHHKVKDFLYRPTYIRIYNETLKWFATMLSYQDTSTHPDSRQSCAQPTLLKMSYSIDVLAVRFKCGISSQCVKYLPTQKLEVWNKFQFKVIPSVRIFNVVWQMRAPPLLFYVKYYIHIAYIHEYREDTYIHIYKRSGLAIYIHIFQRVLHRSLNDFFTHTYIHMYIYIYI